MTAIDAAEEGKRLYGAFLSEDEWLTVDSMSVPDQAYFWARLYYEIPRSMNESMLREMEREVLEGNSIKRKIARGLVKEARSLDDLWEPIKPHAWFGTR